MQPKDKIVLLKDALNWVQEQQKNNRKIVFTNGCFDILHRGHVDYLFRASKLGDSLIVAVNTDSSVKMLEKSPERPIQDEESRSIIIASLYFVDKVILFNEQTPLKLIETLLPDILVKGADYKPEEIVGYKEVTEKGGRVETISFLDGYSTTRIVNKILGN
jgi:rfaE bifunctional protein nucleotidyltransferase chain/domain